MRISSLAVLAALVAGLAAAVPADADGLKLGGGKKSRAALLKSQMALLDGRLAVAYEGSARLKPNSKKAKETTDGSATPTARFKGKYKGEFLEVARAAARKYDVPEDMFLRLVQQESGWNSGAVSPKGATGLAQLMPATAAHLGVDIGDPKQNLEGGARYLRQMYNRFGSWRLALAAYNAGPMAVEKHGGVPPYNETKNYVLAILG
jgi:soluble lytic murein transglycosylase-like protein